MKGPLSASKNLKDENYGFVTKLWCFSDFLLPQDVEYVPDLLVISSQEAYNDRTEWEIRLQDTLGPSHVLYTVNNKESSPHENL